MWKDPELKYGNNEVAKRELMVGQPKGGGANGEVARRWASMVGAAKRGLIMEWPKGFKNKVVNLVTFCEMQLGIFCRMWTMFLVMS